MELNKEQAKIISREFNLGEVISIETINSGLSNNNFLIKTEKGEYFARFTSFEFNENIKQRWKTQIGLLNFLKQEKFEYDIPEPIKNINGGYISNIDKKFYWINKKVEGDILHDFHKLDISQLAKLMAKLHQKTKYFPINKKEAKEIFYDYREMENGLRDIKEKLSLTENKESIDLYMESKLNILEKAFNIIKKVDFGNNMIFIHNDFFVENIVLKNEKITGLIDFDGYRLAPASQDIGVAIQLYCFTKDNQWDNDLAGQFIKAYKEIEPLESPDISLIKLHIIRYSLDSAIFFYYKNKKATPEKKLFLLKWVIGSIENLMKELETK